MRRVLPDHWPGTWSGAPIRDGSMRTVPRDSNCFWLAVIRMGTA